MSSSRSPYSLSSQRQLDSNRKDDIEGSRGAHMIEIPNLKLPKEEKKSSNVDSNTVKIQNEEIILAAEEFEDPVSASRIRFGIAFCITLCLFFIPLIYFIIILKTINIYAIFNGIIYTGLSLAWYMFVFFPIWAIFLSIILTTNFILWNILKSTMLVAESFMVCEKLSRIQNAVKREIEILKRNKLDRTDHSVRFSI